MNFIEASVFILFIAIMSVPLATRLRLPLEVFLVIGSSIIGLLPGLPQFQISPIVVFQLLLPPILFSAAYFTSWRDFKSNLRPITLLAFGLVVFTAAVVACVAKLLLPGFTWAEGFLLGAIVSPSDASAATSLIRKLGAPRRFVQILEGESLINDATALTIYRFSMAAILLGSFSASQAALQFIWIAAGGLVVGICTAYIGIQLVRLLDDTRAETAFTFVVAYAAYFLAEHIQASGIISTVAGGIYFGIRLPEVVSSQTRLNAKASWITGIFIINGFAFTLLGFELPVVVKGLGAYTFDQLFLYGFVISVVVIGLRIIWMFPAAYIPRMLFPSIAKRDPVPPWQFLLALGWTGMRGIVSLAAVLAVPYQLAPNLPFPHRDLLIFITYCVIIATLIPTALTLPYLFRLLPFPEAENKMRQEALARVRISEGILETVTVVAKKENIPAEIVEEFRHQIDRRLRVIATQLEANPYSSLNPEYIAYKKLTMAAIESERTTLLQLRRDGEIHDEVFHQLMEELDLEELRADTLRL